MLKKDQIHRTKTPNRPHYIREWAELRGYERPVDLANALGVDKSNVSRWYAGTSPNQDSQEALAQLFFNDPDEREALFRHPDDDWLARFFRDRSREEIERMKQTLETAFPKRNSNR